MALNKGNRGVTRAIVVASPPTSANENSIPLHLALLNADGSAASTVKKQPAQADSVAADVATLKTDFNSLLAKLRAAGILS